VPFVVATPLMVYALTAPTAATYESSADVLLDRKGQAISGLRDYEWYSFDAARAVNTQVELARLPDIEVRALTAAAERGLNASGLFGRSAVTEDGLTDLMTFHVRDGDPEVAAQLATIYAEQYVAHRRELDTRALRRAIAIVSAQLATVRAQGADPSAYAHLVEKEQQLHTGLATITSNARLVRPGSDTTRVAPAPRHDTLAALALGVIVGLGLAGLANLLDARARTADEISEQLGLPVLGRLPIAGSAARTSAVRALLNGEERSGTEAVRMLRASLALVRSDRNHEVVMVTSSVAGEGKSTTVASLAVALALAGRDVVLVDLDLRRPVLWRIFDLPKAPGIAELARGMARIDEVMHDLYLGASSDDAPGQASDAATATGTLRVVPAGNTLATDLESVVAGDGLRDALGLLRQNADVVFVDSPPVLQTGDVLSLTSVVDSFILVAQTKRYRRHYARELERLLALSPATPLGLVVVGKPHELEPARRSFPASRRERGPEIEGLEPA